MRKYHVNEKELINYLFENNNHYNLNENIFSTNEVSLPSLSSITDDISKRIEPIKSAAFNLAKIAGREIISAPVVKYYCSIIKKTLNRDIETKRLAFPIIKEVFKESIYCLRFFMKSNYSRYLSLVSNSFYSWEIALAMIMLYEIKKDDKPLLEGSTKLKSLSIDDLRTYIMDFYERVQSGDIFLDGKKIKETGGRRGGGGGSQPNASIRNDISTVMNFIISPNYGLMKISKNFNGKYDKDFLNIFDAAKKISGLSRNTVVALEKIVETINDTKRDFENIRPSVAQVVERALKMSPIVFPKNDIIDSNRKTITYDNISGKYKIPAGFDFSTATDGDLNFGIDMNLLRIKFMFLFIREFRKQNNDKNALLDKIISNFTFLIRMR